MKAQEDEELRLQRVKLETSVIEQHNEKLENKEDVHNKPAAEAVAETEVSNIIKSVLFTGCFKDAQPCLMWTLSKSLRVVAGWKQFVKRMQ